MPTVPEPWLRGAIPGVDTCIAPVFYAFQQARQSAEALLAEMERAFASAEAVVRSIDPARLPEPRWVGTKRLPTTVAGLLTHIAEHTQRHIGQAISAAKLSKAMA